MNTRSRSEILQGFRDKIAQGRPIIGGGAGIGLTAKLAEAGGIDLIIIYNSGRYRMAGRGSLAGLMPYGDANAIVMEMAREVLPVVEHTPVLAGVCATDPFRIMSQFLKQVRDARFAGVQNFPTVGLVDGQFRQGLEETGMGYDREVDMIAQARAMDLLTCPYVHDEDEARAMAEAGADVLVPHVGLTTKGMIGARSAPDLATAGPPGPGDGRRGVRGPARRDGPLPRRPDRRAIRRGRGLPVDEGNRGLLRRQQRRAAPDRAGDRRPSPGLRRTPPASAPLRRLVISGRWLAVNEYGDTINRRSLVLLTNDH